MTAVQNKVTTKMSESLNIDNQPAAQPPPSPTLIVTLAAAHLYSIAGLGYLKLQEIFTKIYQMVLAHYFRAILLAIVLCSQVARWIDVCGYMDALEAAMFSYQRYDVPPISLVPGGNIVRTIFLILSLPPVLIYAWFLYPNFIDLEIFHQTSSPDTTPNLRGMTGDRSGLEADILKIHQALERLQEENTSLKARLTVLEDPNGIVDRMKTIVDWMAVIRDCVKVTCTELLAQVNQLVQKMSFERSKLKDIIVEKRAQEARLLEEIERLKLDATARELYLIVEKEEWFAEFEIRSARFEELAASNRAWVKGVQENFATW
ncbi:hypothetical protein BDZ97DRAFT_1918274 [Flammula alnicola]|nr:hypothetical protein BDZ97DRAFT_1918274 [Flammula alnicola]